MSYCFVVKFIGNPGVADFYLEFIECLAKESNELLPIACISHLGHVTVPSHISAAAKGGSSHQSLY